MDKLTNWIQEFSGAERTLPGAGSAWLRDLRRGAFKNFVELGFPTSRQEAWRYSDFSALARAGFRAAPGGTLSRSTERPILNYVLGAPQFTRVVFVNGAFAPEVSTLTRLPGGVTAMSLAAALSGSPDRVRPYFSGPLADPTHPFFALNTAFVSDGFFIHVPAGVHVDEPIHLAFLATPEEGPTMAHPRVILVAESDSRVSVIESHLGSGEGSYFTNAVTEIHAAPGSRVDHHKVQEEGTGATHVSLLRADIHAKAQVHSHLISLGAKKARNEVHCVLSGSGATCSLGGLYVAGSDQDMDQHTVIDHAMPGGKSEEVYKGVLDGRSRGSFTGRIIVREGAQKSDSSQQNRNLLLSEDAAINTRPQLEIYADDVKCSHGATSGQLDKEALFYLRSRGITRDEARVLLTRAFADEIIDRIAIESLRVHLHSRVDGRVAQGRRVKEAV